MRIELTRDVKKRLRSSLREARDREIGGMLFAEQLEPGYFCIVDFSLDPFSGSHAKFQRDPQSHQGTLDNFFRRTGRDFGRFNYLGEWYSHPFFSVHPSMQDVNTMKDIVEDESSVITFAVLLIVGLRFRLWIEHSLTIFARDQAPQRSRISR